MADDPRKSGFLHELKRRKVVRVGLVYLGVAYVVVEAADLLLPRLALPEWTVTFVIALALLGFPIALVLAWAFQLTPGGIRRSEPAVAGGDVPAGRGGRPWISAGTGAAVIGLLLAGTALGWILRPATTSRSDRGAIAVLPFANLSEDAEATAHVSDGFQDDLLTHLYRLGFEVRPRSSVMRYRGSELDVGRIARELDVTHVVQGTLRWSGNRIRVTAELVDPVGDRSLWRDDYDRPFTADSLFRTQSEIARRVAAALDARLSPTQERHLARRPTDDIEAWNWVKRGIEYWTSATDSAGLARAIHAFRRAIELDSAYADPYAGLATVYEFAASNGFFPVEPAYDRARRAIDRSLALDPDVRLDVLTPGPAIEALITFRAERRFESARARFEELEAEGRDAGAYFTLLSALGEHDDAVTRIERRVAAEPASPFILVNYAITLFWARRYDEALDQLSLVAGLRGAAAAWRGRILGAAGRYEEAIGSLEPVVEGPDPSGWGGGFLTWVLGRAGRTPRAREELAALLERDRPPLRTPLAAAYLGAGDRVAALGALEEAAERREASVLYLGQDPIFDALRGDPRFVALMDRIGIPESARRAP